MFLVLYRPVLYRVAVLCSVVLACSAVIQCRLGCLVGRHGRLPPLLVATSCGDAVDTGGEDVSRTDK